MGLLGDGGTPHEVSDASQVALVPAEGSVPADDAAVITARVAHSSVHAVGGSDNQVVTAPAPTSAAPVVAARTYAIPVKTRGLYFSVSVKFTMAMAYTFVWVWFSVWISRGWVSGLAPVTGSGLAWVIVILVAYLPGAIVAFLAVSLILDRQPPLHVASPTTPLTLIIAARNEQGGIGETIAAISRTDYVGPVSVILADNGSTDGTCEVAGRPLPPSASRCASSPS